MLQYLSSEELLIFCENFERRKMRAAPSSHQLTSPSDKLNVLCLPLNLQLRTPPSPPPTPASRPLLCYPMHIAHT